MKVLFMIRSNVIAYHQKEDDQKNALEGLDLWMTKHLLTYITLILLQYKFPRIFSYCSLRIILKILGHASYFTTIKYICKYSMFLSFFYCKTYRGTLNTEEIGCKSCVRHKPPVKLKTWEDQIDLLGPHQDLYPQRDMSLPESIELHIHYLLDLSRTT